MATYIRRYFGAMGSTTFTFDWYTNAYVYWNLFSVNSKDRVKSFALTAYGNGTNFQITSDSQNNNESQIGLAYTLYTPTYLSDFLLFDSVPLSNLKNTNHYYSSTIYDDLESNRDINLIMFSNDSNNTFQGYTYGISGQFFVDVIYTTTTSTSNISKITINQNSLLPTSANFLIEAEHGRLLIDQYCPYYIKFSNEPISDYTGSNNPVFPASSLTINNSAWYAQDSSELILNNLTPNTTYYLAVAGPIGMDAQAETEWAGQLYKGYTVTSYSFTTPNYTACTAPTITTTTSGSNITVSWSGAQAGVGNSIVGYKIGYNDWDSVDEFFNSVTETLSANTTSKTYSLSAGEYYFAVKTLGSQGLDSDWAWTDKVTLMPNYTPCTAPADVTGTVNQSNADINWSGASAGIGNPITGYQIGYNSTGNGTPGNISTISSTSTSGSKTYSNLAGGNYYFAVKTLGTSGTASNPNSDWKWSSKITIGTKPQVTSGATITKAQMDALKTYLGNGNTVTVGNQITATDGATYKSGPTVNAAITASWYNT